MLEILYEKFYFWIEIASIVLAIASYILIIIQSSNNYMFKNYKTRSLIAERVLYEQFSYEVRDSIKSFPYTNNDNPSDNYEYKEYIKVEAKLNSYYDCRDVYDPELNEEICQNQIVKNNTCCKSECCLKTNGDETFCYNYVFDLYNKDFKNHRILYYNDEEYFEDPKRRFCSYYNKYTTDINLRVDDGELYLYKCKYDYKSIYLNKAPHMCIGKSSCNNDLYIDCGIIDTKYNHLFVDNTNYCPIVDINGNNNNLNIYHTGYEYSYNNNKIIIRIILSELSPDIHEWKNHFVSLENYENKESEKYENLRKKISDIREKDFENLMSKYSSIYKERSFSLNGDYFSGLNINSKANFKMYTTNYIGFGSQDDLLTFLDIFKGDTDNPLYRLGKEVYPSLETIICGAVLCVLCIIYLILFLIKLIEKYLWIFIIKECVLGVTFFILLGIYIWQVVIFKKIKIDMDSNFENILDLYNNRRMQYCLLSALILLFISIIPVIIFLIIKLIKKCKEKFNQPRGNPGNQENQERPPQNNANENSPSHYQIPEEQQTLEQPSPNQNILNSENQNLNANNNIEENVREGNDVVIHNERNQNKKK